MDFFYYYLGTKTACTALSRRVTPEGIIIEDNVPEGQLFVGTRHAELAKQRAALAAVSREATLERLGAALSDGPGRLVLVLVARCSATYSKFSSIIFMILNFF